MYSGVERKEGERVGLSGTLRRGFDWADWICGKGEGGWDERGGRMSNGYGLGRMTSRRERTGKEISLTGICFAIVSSEMFVQTITSSCPLIKVGNSICRFTFCKICKISHHASL